MTVEERRFQRRAKIREMTSALAPVLNRAAA